MKPATSDCGTIAAADDVGDHLERVVEWLRRMSSRVLYMGAK